MQHASRLAQMIHSHWLKHCPGLVEELTAKGQLAQALQETEERTADLLYELISVKKMQYQAAWELATQEWSLPETEALPKESSSASPSQSPLFSRRATSE